MRYLAGNNAFQPFTEMVYAFNLQPYAGKFFSQLLRSDINIYILFKPINRC